MVNLGWDRYAEWHITSKDFMDGRIAAALHLHKAQFPLRKARYAVCALLAGPCDIRLFGHDKTIEQNKA